MNKGISSVVLLAISLCLDLNLHADAVWHEHVAGKTRPLKVEIQQQKKTQAKTKVKVRSQSGIKSQSDINGGCNVTAWEAGAKQLQKVTRKMSVVIPIDEFNLCWANLQLRGLSKYVDPKQFTDVHYIWVSEEPASVHEHELNNMVLALTRDGGFETVKLHSARDKLNCSAEDLTDKRAMQVDFLAHSVVENDYYLVLNVEDVPIRQIDVNDFFNACGEPLYVTNAKYENASDYQQFRYNQSMEALGLTGFLAGEDEVAMLMPPYVLNKKLAAGLLDLMKTKELTLDEIFDSGASSIALYYLYITTKKTKLEMTAHYPRVAKYFKGGENVENAVVRTIAQDAEHFGIYKFAGIKSDKEVDIQFIDKFSKAIADRLGIYVDDVGGCVHRGDYYKWMPHGPNINN